MTVSSYIKISPLVLMKILRNTVFFMIIFGKAYAGCPTVAHVTGPATLTVNPSVPVGTVMASITLNWGDTRSTCAITSPGGQGMYEFKGEGVPNGHFYPTSVTGLSYEGKLPGWAFASLDGYWPEKGRWGNGGGTVITGGSAVISFVKTGPIAGDQSFGPVMLMEGTIDDQPWFDIYMDNTIIIKPTSPACTITQSTIPVILDTASPGDLKTTGATAKDKSFNIPLKCDTEENIALTFSGTVADSTNGVFKSSDAETADKVGIQLLDKNSTPVPTDADHSVPVGKINGPYNYPMTARYYALAPGVTAGKVSTVVNATIIYN